MPKAIAAEFHIRCRRVDGMGQTLGRPIRWPECHSSQPHSVAIGLLPSVGCGDHAVLDPGALTIANPVKRAITRREPSASSSTELTRSSSRSL